MLLSDFTPVPTGTFRNLLDFFLLQRLAGLVYLGEHSKCALGMSKWTAPQSKPLSFVSVNTEA